MMPLAQERPRVGVVGLAYPGHHLGDELGESKVREMLRYLGPAPLALVPAGAWR